MLGLFPGGVVVLVTAAACDVQGDWDFEDMPSDPSSGRDTRSVVHVYTQGLVSRVWGFQTLIVAWMYFCWMQVACLTVFP